MPRRWNVGNWERVKLCAEGIITIFSLSFASLDDLIYAWIVRTSFSSSSLGGERHVFGRLVCDFIEGKREGGWIIRRHITNRVGRGGYWNSLQILVRGTDEALIVSSGFKLSCNQLSV